MVDRPEAQHWTEPPPPPWAVTSGPAPPPSPPGRSAARVALVVSAILIVVGGVVGGAMLLPRESDEAELTRSSPSTVATTAAPRSTESETATTVALGPQPAPSGLQPGYLVRDKTEVVPGVCLTDTGWTDPTGQSGIIEVAACSAPHDSEVYLVEAFWAGETFPGDNVIAQDAGVRCEAAFDAYVGAAYVDSVLDFAFYVPNEVTWQKYDDRTVVCVLTDPDFEQLSAPMWGSRR